MIWAAQSGVCEPVAFAESEIKSKKIGILDFKFELPQCMKYLIVRKLKEDYDCIVNKSITYCERTWYQKATTIEVKAIEIVQHNERLVYYGSSGNGIRFEEKILLGDCVDVVDKITLSIDRVTEETVVSESIELDFYIEGYTNTLTSLVFLTTKIDLKLKEGVDLLLSLVFEPFEALPVEKYTFVTEAVDHLRGVLSEEDGEATKIVIESGIRNLVLDSVPKNVLTTIVIYDEEIDIVLRSSPKRMLKNPEALFD